MSARKLSSASQIPNPPSTAPAVNSWAQNSPVGQWPANVLAQYAVTFFNAAGETAFGPWGSMSGAGSARADLEDVPVDPSGQATGRNIYRELQGFNVQLVGTINDNTTTVFQDTDTSVPLSPPTTAPDLPSQSWAQNTPIGQWPVGVQASYAVSFLNGSYETALGPWVPFSGGGYWALALLTDIPTDPTGQASGRNIYRQLEGFDPQLIGTIGDNTTTEFQDNSTTVPQRTLNIDSRLKTICTPMTSWWIRASLSRSRYSSTLNRRRRRWLSTKRASCAMFTANRTDRRPGVSWHRSECRKPPAPA